MSTTYRLIIGLGLFILLIIGCSKIYEPAIPPEAGQSSNDVDIKLPTGEDVLREAAVNYDNHDYMPEYQMTFSDEFIEGSANDDRQSMLVDSIAASLWIESLPASVHTYVLVCSSAHIWGGSGGQRIRIYRVHSDGTVYYDPAFGLVMTSCSVSDPDACTIAVFGNELYAWFSSENDKLFCYKWDITTSGPYVGQISNTSSGWDQISSDPCESIDVANALAVIPTNRAEDEWHLFVCDRDTNELLVYDETATEINDSPIHDFGVDTPVDICAVKYLEEEADDDYWFVYIAVQDEVDADDDYIMCIKWDPDDDEYDAGTQADDVGGGLENDNFPGIIGLDVRHHVFHNYGVVGVLMRDLSDLKNYRLRQVDFGNTSSTYYEFEDEFDSTAFQDTSTYPNSYVDKAESFAMSYGVTRSGADYYYGNSYYIGDRDPDLTQDDEFDHDGENIIVFKNSTSGQ